jgi:hypothetical protein
MVSRFLVWYIALQLIIIGPTPPPHPLPAAGTTYYVRTDGSNSNNGLANTSGGAWLTIDKCADTVSAGDTCRVQAGNYAARVTPSRNGTALNPITFIADGAVEFCGIDLASNSYLRFIGFTMDTDTLCAESAGVISASAPNTNTGLEFWNNTIRDADRGGVFSSLTSRFHQSLFVGNVLSNFGAIPSAAAGSGMGFGVYGNNNLFAYNELTNIHPDGFIINGVGSQWLNNWTHDFSEASGGHPDIFQAGSSVLGFSYALIEATFQEGAGTASPNEHTAQISNSQHVSQCGGLGLCGVMTENIWRGNIFSDLGSGTIGINQASDAGITYTRAYHNATANVQRSAATTQRATAWFCSGCTGVTNNYLLNDLFYEGWGATPSTNPDVVFIQDAPYVMNYNLAYDPDGSITFAAGWTNQANEVSNLDPDLNDVASHDLTLGAASAAIGAAGPLTTTSGSGTGKTFNVVAGGGGFFRGPNTNITQYGGRLTAGDVITVGTDVVTVESVATDAITVTPSFTWADAEPVYYGTDTTPDIGAYPYRAGGYALSATYVSAGGTITITPNDASLVRFAVCYDAGVPYTVDPTAPYTCAVPTGALTIRVYPRYASATLWAVATP